MDANNGLLLQTPLPYQTHYAGTTLDWNLLVCEHMMEPPYTGTSFYVHKLRWNLCAGTSVRKQMLEPLSVNVCLEPPYARASLPRHIMLNLKGESDL